MLPLAETSAGKAGFADSLNSSLSGAMDLFGQYSKIKQQHSASGGDLPQAKLTNEVENGSSVVMETPSNSSANNSGANKPLLYVSLGLLGLAFVMRMKGFK
jgi:hypothetical protein